MSAPADVNPLHSSYIELSARYKAAWAFHRFVEGLRKFFGNHEIDGAPLDFQNLYKGLKEVSSELNDPDLRPASRQLDALRSELDRLLAELDEQDRKIAPSLMRLFFQRIRSSDERILIDLVRFYQEVQRGRSWDETRIDKVDYLLSRLAEAIAGTTLEGDRGRLKKVLEAISSQHTPSANVDPQKITNRQKLIQAVRNEIRQVETFEQLTEKELVEHYRAVKHGLGNLLFERSILPAVIDTNALLSARIRELSEVEERKIFADYEKISQLEEEGRGGREASQQLAEIHQQVASFQKHLSAGNLRLAELVSIGSALRELLAQLEHQADGEPAGRDLELTAASVFAPGVEREIVGPLIKQLIEALDETLEDGEGASHAMSPSVLPFRLEGREVEAHRRLAERDAKDERLEKFVLAAAALRRRVNREVEEIHAARSRGGGDTEIAQETRRTLRIADWYLRQFSHFLEEATLGNEGEEARQLQKLRMRLMRDYSGLWLVVHTSA